MRYEPIQPSLPRAHRGGSPRSVGCSSRSTADSRVNTVLVSPLAGPGRTEIELRRRPRGARTEQAEWSRTTPLVWTRDPESHFTFRIKRAPSPATWRAYCRYFGDSLLLLVLTCRHRT